MIIFIAEHKSSDNLILGKRINVHKEAIGSEGGVINVGEFEGPIQGLRIEIPDGAYGKKTTFNIQYQPIGEHKLGEWFNPVSPLITINNGGSYSEEPMLVTFLIPDDPDLFTMIFYYDRKNGSIMFEYILSLKMMRPLKQTLLLFIKTVN